MNRKKATLITVILAVVLVLSVITAAIGWGPTKTGAVKNIKLGLDLSGGVSVTYQTKDGVVPDDEEMSDTIYKLQQRVTNYSTESSVYKEGLNRINIEIPGVNDANAVLEELGKPGSLEFTLTDGTVILTGADVASAQAGSQKNDMGNSEYVVSLSFSDEGKDAFAKATTDNVGKQIQIVYDGEVISAPVVREAITDGKCVISGSFTMDSASELASYIRIGSLSLELEEIRSNVVGAQLGQRAISTSLMAGLIGLVIVMILMVIVYKMPGMIAALSLVFYAAFDLILINAFDMTLTLAGIAGVILSIGMAVDANVIIYARIREEIAAGKTVRNAIDIGFKKALTAIIDGNVTTLIAAVVLNYMGTGSIKGFAQTLALGIILSMFTACVVSRLMINCAYELGMRDEKYYGKAREYKVIDFVGKRVMYFVIALAVICAGFAFMFINRGAGKGSLNYSVEFQGGTSTSVTFNEDYSIEQLDKDIIPVIMEVTGDADVQAQKVAGGSKENGYEVIFKTRSLTNDEADQMQKALDEAVGIAEYTDENGEVSKKVTTETISSIISKEMSGAAIKAVIIAVILMLLYIWLRFSDFRFASSAVIALCHDVLVVLACYSIVRISVGNTFIACMLTIVGYSINATIVIFDRIRENLKIRAKNETLAELVNKSITQTLTRSIYTSLTTFITIAMLYLIGVPSIKEFALPLMVGIVAGAYSSVFVTGSLWYMMRQGAEKKAAAAQAGRSSQKASSDKQPKSKKKNKR